MVTTQRAHPKSSARRPRRRSPFDHDREELGGPEQGMLNLQRLVGNRAISTALTSVQREQTDGQQTTSSGAATTATTSPPTTTTSSASALATTSTAPSATTSTSSSATASTTTASAPKRDAVGVPGTIGELVANLTEQNVTAWRSDESAGLSSKLWQILKGPFGANWFRTKAYLAQNQWERLPPNINPATLHGPAVSLMTGMVEMRAAVFNQIKEATLQALPRRVESSAQLQESRTAWRQLHREAQATDASGKATDDLMKFKGSVGSDTVTSDVDVATAGSNTERGVALFNQTFRQRTGVPYDAGTVFDLNVYALDFMHGDPSVDEGTRVLTPGAAEHADLSPEAATARADDQEIWSIVH